MSGSVEPPNANRPGSAPAGKRTGVSSRARESGKEGGSKSWMRARAYKNQTSEPVFRCNVSADGSCSSDSSGSFSSVRPGSFPGRRKQKGVKCGKVAPDGVEASKTLKAASGVDKKRCGWITPSSDPLYVSFHDEEWGVPVHDDGKLFELLVLSEALGELSWPTILSKRDTFKKLFDNFDPVFIAEFSEKKILSLAGSGSALLSEPKLRAIVENARQILKAAALFDPQSSEKLWFPLPQRSYKISWTLYFGFKEQVKEEFGSFSNYCWRFVNHKPIVNGFRYARNVPVKTPKAEAISKDMMKRGFRCVGPTIVYSFMQAAGIVNDHISSCFRYKECHPNVKKDCAAEVEEMDKLVKSAEQACLLQA